jgi:hypothetical protein
MAIEKMRRLTQERLSSTFTFHQSRAVLAKICILTGIFASYTTAKAQILVNGSFEQPVLSSTMNFFGAFSFMGWSGASTGGGGNAGLVVGTNVGLTPEDGNQAFAFNGNNPPDGTYIEQTFSTTIGQTYMLDFWLGRNGDPLADVGPELLEAQVAVLDASNTTISSITAEPPSTDTWSMSSLGFTADSSTSTVIFTDISGSNPNSDLFLDNVSVSVVPEPSTFAALVGLSVLGYAVYRRNKTA